MRSATSRPCVPVRRPSTSAGSPSRGAPTSGTCGRPRFDVLRRWLTHGGLEVTYVRNVTDIDDKILAKADAHGVPWWAWAYDNERACTRAYDVLGVPPTYEPRATGHILEMVVLMERLIERGHAYAADGDVYFDVRSFPEYGALTGRSSATQSAADTETDDRKRDPRDFAPGRRTRTASRRRRPGRPPGAAAARLAPGVLGDGRALPRGRVRHPRRRPGPALPAPRERAGAVPRGRRRLRPVLAAQRLGHPRRREDEQVDGQHGAGRRGRSVRPVELRYYLVAPHYRSSIEFTDAALEEAPPATGGSSRSSGAPPSARARTPGARALRRVHQRPGRRPRHPRRRRGDPRPRPRGQHRAGRRRRHGAVAGTLGSVRAMLGVLGLDPLDPQWADGAATTG